MESINWPLWIIAFSILLIALAACAVLASLVMLLRKIAVVADMVGLAVSQTGSIIRKKFSGSDAYKDIPAVGKGSVVRGLSIVSAIVGTLISLARRKKPRL